MSFVTVITAKIRRAFDDLWIDCGSLLDMNHDCLGLVTNHRVQTPNCCSSLSAGHPAAANIDVRSKAPQMILSRVVLHARGSLGRVLWAS